MDKFRYEQRWTITISGRTKEAVKKAMDKVVAPAQGFRLLRMDDISSVSTSSTKIEDRKEGDKMSDGITGYSEEGYCEPQGATGWKPDTIYEARVAAGRSAHRIYFLFSNSHKGGKCVSIGEGIHTGPEWSVYHIGTATEVHHTCPEGTWVLFLRLGYGATWAFREKGGRIYTPTISLANDEGETRAQKVWREMQEEEKYGTAVTPAEYAKAEAKRTIEWYKMREAKERRDGMTDAAIYGISMEAAKRQRQGIITSIEEKEVKKKMTNKSLFHVILFNRKTEEIEFDKIMPAKGEQAAVMQAAQTYGKYDSKIHLTIVWQIQYSEYATID